MEISVEIKRYEQTFRTTIAGVTKQNPDGTERQALIKTLSRGEAVRLVREAIVRKHYSKWIPERQTAFDNAIRAIWK
jgi:hypothetical protein